MPSILKTVKWGITALKFLDQPMKRINKDKPALIFLRHSKADYSQVNSLREGILTEQGIEASLEFGERLPNTNFYRIYHSEYPRATITAEGIHQGIMNQKGESTLIGSRPYLMFSKSDDTQIGRYFNRARARDFQIHWISGRYPPKDVESSLELAIESAKQVTYNLSEAEPSSIDLYVTHDIIILVMLFHWFGVFHVFPWAGLLDGFILQLYEKKMIFIDKEGEHKVDYPHWWTIRS